MGSGGADISRIQTRSPEGERSRASIEIGAHPFLQGGVGCASFKPTICERVPEGGSGGDRRRIWL